MKEHVYFYQKESGKSGRLIRIQRGLNSLTVEKNNTLNPLYYFLFEFSNHKFNVQKLETPLLTVSCTESDTAVFCIYLFISVLPSDPFRFKWSLDTFCLHIQIAMVLRWKPSILVSTKEMFHRWVGVYISVPGKYKHLHPNFDVS